MVIEAITRKRYDDSCTLGQRTLCFDGDVGQLRALSEAESTRPNHFSCGVRTPPLCKDPDLNLPGKSLLPPQTLTGSSTVPGLTATRSCLS